MSPTLSLPFKPKLKAPVMSNTNTPTRHEPMSAAWCLGLQQTVSATLQAAKRDTSQATIAAARILAAASVAGNQPTQTGLQRTWTGDSALRLWGRACSDLRALETRNEHHQPRLLDAHDLTTLARLPMQFLDAAVRLYAEVAPALLASASGDDQRHTEVELLVKLQEFILNYVITPKIIDAHQALTRTLREIESCVSEGNAAQVVCIAQDVAAFSSALCKLSAQHAPSTNAYAALTADEFTADIQRIVNLSLRGGFYRE